MEINCRNYLTVGPVFFSFLLKKRLIDFTEFNYWLLMNYFLKTKSN